MQRGLATVKLFPAWASPLTHTPSELTMEHITGKTGSLNHEGIHSWFLPKRVKCLEKETKQAILHARGTLSTSITTKSIIQSTDHFHLSQSLVFRRLLARIHTTIPTAFCKKNSSPLPRFLVQFVNWGSSCLLHWVLCFRFSRVFLGCPALTLGCPVFIYPTGQGNPLTS